MAWNRPSEDKAKVKVRGEQRNAHLKGLVAGSVVVVVAGVAAWWLWPTGESAGETPPPQATQRIREVKPAAAPKPFVTKPGWVLSTNKFGKVFEHPTTNRYGCPYHWGPNATPPPARTAKVDTVNVPLHHKVFKTLVDRDIYRLLTIEPGTPLMDVVTYDEDFVDGFLRSLKEPVFVSSEDTEEVKAMKRAVNETKIELKARYDAGEDIAKIMNDTRKELVQLGAYRDELDRMVTEKMRDRKTSRADLEDIVAAANKMLSERGLKKITLPEFYYQRVELRNKRYKEKSEGEKK